MTGLVRYGLVIFDCAGVLVDTENLANTRLAELITEAGLPITAIQCRQRFTGLSMRSIRQRLLKEDGIELGDDFVEHWNRGLPDLMRGKVAAIPYIEQAIRAVAAARVDMCVASSGRLEKMRMTLGSTGLLPWFEKVLFSASMVADGKPAPDLFLHAAHEMGYDPADCAVVEDSVPGVQAAVAAGTRAFGYCGDPLTPAAELQACGAFVFRDMRQLPRLLNLG